MEAGVCCPRHISSVITGDNAQSSTSNGNSSNQGNTKLANIGRSKSDNESLFWSTQLRVAKWWSLSSMQGLVRVLAQCSERTSRASPGPWGIPTQHRTFCSHCLFWPSQFDPKNNFVLHLLIPPEYGLLGLQEFIFTRSLITVFQLVRSIFECIKRDLTPWKQLSPQEETLCWSSQLQSWHMLC